jgi:hypothetical protein
LAPVWALAYRTAARAWSAFLTRGESDAAAYVRGSLGVGDTLPGLSDVDMAIVLAEDPAGPGLARERAAARWQRLRRALRLTDLLLDYPLICEDSELAEMSGSSALTYGLAAPAGKQAAYFGQGAGQDRTRMLERPGLYGATADWRLIAGPERRAAEPPRDAQSRRIAGWLELVSWWQWVFPACADPAGPRTASLCTKLVAEPARIWLWLADGERVSGRAEVLGRARRRFPEEEDAFRRALELQRSLPDSPDPPLAEVLPVLVRLSARIAELIAAQIEDQGATGVRLAGADPSELVLAQGEWRRTAMLAEGRELDLLPLCDWKSLACPYMPDESFAQLPGDPGDPALLGAATRSQPAGPYPALQARGLMVLPAERWRSRLRAVTCPVTDPVSFALAAGDTVARFPNVDGWSAEHAARRAVAEHRAWLWAAPVPPDGSAQDAQGIALAMLLSAARAALFLESLSAGNEPELAVTLTATARRLAERSAGARAVAEEAVDGYRAFAAHRTPPPARTVAAMRTLVQELHVYAEDSPAALAV